MLEACEVVLARPLTVKELVDGFEACTLPRERWNHSAHLTVAAWYLISEPKKEATISIKSGIKRYNRAVGASNTENSGYHETVTLFFIWAVSRYLGGIGIKGSPDELVAGLLASECGNKNFPFEYYSRERIRSKEAKVRWVPPDLRPLD